MAKLQLSLRARIFLSMMILIIITFLLTGGILTYHFQKEEEQYHKNRLLRKEYAVHASIDYFLTPYKEGITEKEIPELFSEKICEIADIHNLDIALYSTSGYLLISSDEEIIDDDILPLKLDNTLLYQVINRKKSLQLITKDSIDYLNSYSVLYNDDGRPMAVMTLPYYLDVTNIPDQDVQFIRTLSVIYLALFIAAVIIAYLLSNYITGSLRTVGEKLKDIRLNRRNEKLVWKSGDEIGELVDEYNRMVEDLEESAVKLAKTERETAWKEMARQVAHEIKNPLTPMRLMVQYMDTTLKTEEPEVLHEHTQAMIDQIDAMSSIAESFSRFANMPEYNKERIDLNELLGISTTLYPDLEVRYADLNHPVYAVVDRELIVRVLNNLIKNAQQAMPEDRKALIEVSVNEQKEKLIISVKDNGTGIPEDKKDKIFEPSFTTKSTGMGMGLAIVQTIVEGLEGKIWFESEVDVGTTFFIQFNKAE